MTALALSKMRRFVARPATAACELCAAALTEPHDHLLEPEHRHLYCVCRACHLLFPSSGAARLLRVNPRATRLTDVDVDDATWAALGIPVGLAFFFTTHRSDEVMATFPGPAGTVESTVPRGVWRRLCDASPALARIVHDTEALLVSRTGARRHCFHVSIDRCYELAGLLRSRRGPMSMIDTGALDAFFADLDARSAS
jgi:hypothetical protein